MKKKMGIEGEGPKIIILFVIYFVAAYFLNKNYPSSFIIANDKSLITIIAIVLAAIGVIFWLWSVILLLVNFPKGKLITTGPYAIFLHPLYNSFTFFILPALAFYLDSWIYFGASIVLLLGTITFGRKEEEYLRSTFGNEYKTYRKKVWFKF